jgi:pSer/pThr/pTyr-binding forkhead associated (FHA) protein
MKNDHVIISIDKIYVDHLAKKVFLIYLPVNIVTGDKAEPIEAAIKKIILNIILDHNSLYDNSIQELYDDIKSRDLPLEMINNKIQRGDYYKSDKKSNDPKEKNNRLIKRMTLISINAPEAIVMRIDKDEFPIGKKVGEEYGLIRNYPTISREHCKITYEDGHYYITDLNSANGTYINEKKIPSLVPYPLNIKDRLRLANLIFDIQES